MNRQSGNWAYSVRSDSSNMLVLRNTELDLLRKMQQELTLQSASKNLKNEQEAENDTVSEGQSCELCLKSSPTCAKQNLFVVTECNHELCIECILKWIYFSQNTNCPFCRRELKKIYVYDVGNGELSKKDDIKGNFNFEMFYFDDESYKNTITDLVYLKCPKCDYFDNKNIKPPYEKSPLFNSFFKHISQEHHMKLCKLCMINFEFFVPQFEIYSSSGFRDHMTNGSFVYDSFVRHYTCTLCTTREAFFNFYHLLNHCIRNHITCYVCDQNIVGYFFSSREFLFLHLREEHFKCPVCMERGDAFFAFSTFLELKSHCKRNHPSENVSLKSLQELNKNLLKSDNNSNNESHRVIYDRIDNLLRSQYQTITDTRSFNPSTEDYLMSFPSISGNSSQQSQYQNSFAAYQRNRPGSLHLSSMYESQYPALGSSSATASSSSKQHRSNSSKKSTSKQSLWSNHFHSKASTSNQMNSNYHFQSHNSAKSNRDNNRKVPTQSSQVSNEYPPLRSYSNQSSPAMSKEKVTPKSSRVAKINSDSNNSICSLVNSMSITGNLVDNKTNKNSFFKNAKEDFPSLNGTAQFTDSSNVDWKANLSLKLNPVELPKKAEKKPFSDLSDFPQLQPSTSQTYFSGWAKQHADKSNPKRKNNDEIIDSSFIKVKDYSDRCVNTRNMIINLLNDQGENMETFKKICIQYRNSSIPVVIFYEKCQSILGDNFNDFIQDLIVQLPDISKQNELFEYHRDMLKKNRKAPKRSPIVKCKICSQLVLTSDLNEHQQHH